MADMVIVDMAPRAMTVVILAEAVTLSTDRATQMNPEAAL
jgi:hypothetical protein